MGGVRTEADEWFLQLDGFAVRVSRILFAMFNHGMAVFDYLIFGCSNRYLKKYLSKSFLFV